MVFIYQHVILETENMRQTNDATWHRSHLHIVWDADVVLELNRLTFQGLHSCDALKTLIKFHAADAFKTNKQTIIRKQYIGYRVMINLRRSSGVCYQRRVSSGVCVWQWGLWPGQESPVDHHLQWSKTVETQSAFPAGVRRGIFGGLLLEIT